MIPVDPALAAESSEAPSDSATTQEKTRTERVIDKYLTQQADGTYELNQSALKTQENWKDLGVVGFFLYNGWVGAADVILRPYEHVHLCDLTSDPDRHIQMDNLGQKYDASHFDYMQSSIDLVNDLNAVRELENQEEGTNLFFAKMAPEAVAYEVRAANFSALIAFEHCQANWNNCEILARCSDTYEPGRVSSRYNPFRLWYFKEKEAYLAGKSATVNVGHYFNICKTEGMAGMAECWYAAGGARSGLSSRELTITDIENGVTAVGGNTLSDTYCVGGITKASVASKQYTVMEIEEYQQALDTYKAFVASLPSDPSSALDPDDASGSESKPAVEKEKPQFSYASDYRWAPEYEDDPYHSETVVHVVETGSPITLDIQITYKGQLLAEGVDYTIDYRDNLYPSHTLESPWAATWRATPTEAFQKQYGWWSLEDTFVIDKKPVDTSIVEYSFSAPHTYKMQQIDGVWYAQASDLSGNPQLVRYESFGRLSWHYQNDDHSEWCSKGWYSVNGKRYYVYSNYGDLVSWDETIDGVPYEAIYDEAVRAYHLVKSTKPTVTPGGSTGSSTGSQANPSTPGSSGTTAGSVASSGKNPSASSPSSGSSGNATSSSGGAASQARPSSSNKPSSSSAKPSSTAQSKKTKASVPSKVKAKATSQARVKVTWGKAKNAKKYVVYRSTKKKSGFKKLATTSKRSYTDKNVALGKKYYYKVKALDAKGAATKCSKVASAKAKSTFKNSFVKLTIPKYWRGKVKVAQKTYAATGLKVVDLRDSKTGCTLAHIELTAQGSEAYGDPVTGVVKELKRGKKVVQVWAYSWASSLYYSRYLNNQGNPSFATAMDYYPTSKLTKASTNRLIKLSSGGRLSYAKVKHVSAKAAEKYTTISARYVKNNLRVRVVK